MWNLTTDAPDNAGFGLRHGAWAQDAVARLRAHGSLVADANETVLFSRQLEHIESEILRAQYRDVMYSEVVDVQVSGLNPADRLYTWREEDYTVQWQEKGSNKQDDKTRNSRARAELSRKFYSFSAEYEYDFQDLREAQRLGISLDAENGVAAREGWERLLENIVASGYGNTDMVGFLNNSAVNVDTEVAALHTLSGENLYNRMKTIVSDLILAQKNVGGLQPNQMTVYPALFEALVNKHFSVDNTRSVLSALQDYFQARGMAGFRFVSWRFCEEAGASGKHRCVLHRKDPAITRAVVSVPFEQLPIFRTKYGWEVPCHARTAGVVIRRVAGVNYIDVPTS